MPATKNIEEVLDGFVNRLEAVMKGQSGGSSPHSPFKQKAIAKQNEAQLFFNEGGLFVDCALQSPVMNALIQPLNTLANAIPVEATIDENIKYGFLTDLEEAGTTPQDYPCDPPPSVGDIDIVMANYEIGRLSYETNTLEIDALIKRAHRGVKNDFYFVGSVRGVSAVPSREDMLDRDFIKQGAVRRQMQLVMRAFQRTLSQWLWIGDPADVTQNGAHGGWKSFPGLMQLVADDYDTKTFITGTGDKTLLNSDVKDFSLEAGGGLLGVDNFYAYMEELEDTIYNRAAMMGLIPTEWYWVFNPITWSQVVKNIPCEMLSSSCGTGVITMPVGNISDGSNALFNLAMRQQMLNTMTVDVNGRTYPVYVDDAIPLDYNSAGGHLYTASAFFLPSNVAGEEVLKWLHMDYTEFDDALAPIPDTQGMKGWSDSGRFHWIVANDRRCFVLDAKGEFAPIFRAPHLAGRIDGITARTLQRKPEGWAVNDITPP